MKCNRLEKDYTWLVKLNWLDLLMNLQRSNKLGVLPPRSLKRTR